jgi:ABC-type transport system involved in cytochrome c biogenesis permease subunit
MLAFTVLQILRTLNYANGKWYAYSDAVLFVLHTVTLAACWYIYLVMPWSNAYEAIVYVVWSMLFLISFDIKSLTVASCAFVTSMILSHYMN